MEHKVNLNLGRVWSKDEQTLTFLPYSVSKDSSKERTTYEIIFPFFIYPSYYDGTISQIKNIYMGRFFKELREVHIKEILILGKKFAEKNHYPAIDQNTEHSDPASLDLTALYVFNKGLLYLDSKLNELFKLSKDEAKEETDFDLDDFPIDIDKGVFTRTILFGHQPPKEKPSLSIKWRPPEGVRTIKAEDNLLDKFF